MLTNMINWTQITFTASFLFTISIAKQANHYSIEKMEGAHIPSQRVLSEHKVGSRQQCVHCCNRNPECVDAVMREDDVCLLLKAETQGKTNDTDSRKENYTVGASVKVFITEVKFEPGIIFL